MYHIKFAKKFMYFIYFYGIDYSIFKGYNEFKSSLCNEKSGSSDNLREGKWDLNLVLTIRYLRISYTDACL
jgi:hypothetical protein